MNDGVTSEHTTNEPVLMVALGAAEGGHEALGEFIAALDADVETASGVCVVLIHHAGADDHPPETFGHPKHLKIRRLDSAMSPERGVVYVVPPRSVLTVGAKGLGARAVRDAAEGHSVVDLAFTALAEAYHRRLVAVVLSGNGGDGTAGLRAVFEGCGLTVAQSPDGCDHPGMPTSAISSGVVSRVLPIAKLVVEVRGQLRYLARLAEPGVTEGLREQIGAALTGICDALLKTTNHDFKYYKSSTLVRRVERRMQLLHLDRVDDYLERLAVNGAEADALFRELLINVTGFFRDPEVFTFLADSVLSKAVTKRVGDGKFRIWIPGCSTGEEVYTIAILMREKMEQIPHAPVVQIIATDIDEHALNVARKGIYPLGIERTVSRERLAKYFERRGAAYQVRRELREMCLFSAHNLVNDPPFSRLDLISCRNVLIYLGASLQRKLIPVFHYALRAGGHLVLGNSETLTSHQELFRTVSAKYRISRRRPTAVRTPTLSTTAKGPYPPHFTNAPRRREADLHLISQRMVLDEFVPRYAVVNENGLVISVSVGIRDYFAPSEGAFDSSLVKLVRAELRLGLRTALKEAAITKRPAEAHATLEDRAQRVGLVVQPMPKLGEESSLYLVVFRDYGPSQGAVGAPQPVGPSGEFVAQLERELTNTRRDLDRTVQDLEASNEELKSSNEELLSINEELQSANEELEASKDEVQRYNEALQRSNSDLENLLNSTKIATLFLDDRLRIRGFTPSISDVYRIQTSDVGRHIGDFTSPALDMPEVDGRPGEAEVRLRDGRTFLRRTLPYLTSDQRADGSVITFVDVSDLRRSEERFRALVQASSQIVWTKNRHGISDEDSPSWRAFTGQTLEEYLDQGWKNAVHVDDRPAVDRAWRAAVQGGSAYDVEYRLRRIDGSWHWTHARGAPLFDADGSLRGWVGMNIDINQRKVAQINYERNVDASPAILWITEPNGACSYLSRQWLEFTGQTREQALGFGWLDAVHPDDSAASGEAFRRANETNTPFYFEYRLRTQTGAYRWAIDAGNPRFDQDGTYLGMAGAVFDIHERKMADDARRESEDRFRIMADSAPVLVWMAGTDRRLHWFNRGWLDWTGRASEDEVGEGWLSHVHPDDQARTAKSFAENFEHRREFTLEFRLRHRTDDFRWINVRAVPRYTPEGSFAGYIGGCMDVNDERAIAERLRESEARFRTITEAMPQMVWTARPDGSHEYFNRRWYEFTGVPTGATDEDRWTQVLHPEDAAHAGAAWAHSLATGDPYQIEYRLRHHSGEYRWTLARALPVRGDAGEITRWMGTCTDVHDRRMVAEALRMSEERYRVITEVSPQIVWAGDQSGALIYFNQVWYDLTGLSTEQSVGEGWLRAVHPDHVERVGRAWRDAIQSGSPYDVEFPFRSVKDGEYRWHLTRGLPVRDARGAIERWVGVAVDVHESRLARERLIASEHLLKTITDNTASSLFMMDRQGHPTFMNPAAEKLTGYTLDQITHRPLHYSVHYRKPDGSDYPMEECPIDNAQVELKPVQNQEEVFVDKTGRLFPVSFSVAPLERDGEVTGSVLEFRDISSQKEVEGQLRDAKDAAERANEAKSTFLANMSHEIRTPLGAIAGFSDLLREECPPDSTAAGYVTRIARNAMQLGQLIDELLDLSKIEAKRLHVDRVRVDLAAVIDDVFAAVGLQAKDKGIEFGIERAGAVPEYLSTDPTRFRQILINLIGNAVKFSEHGRITVNLDGANDTLRISITDPGIGLTEEQRAKLFQPFSQADSSITRKYGGTGLGLALSRDLARLLGGDIKLTASAPGRGSTFTLTLPISDDGARVETPTTKPVPADRPLHGRSILIVDDSPDNQMMVTHFLERTGARLAVASDGVEAVAKATAGDFDVILMDLQMPKMDGYSALKTLRDGNYRQPIVALTAHALKSERERCRAAGFDGYVTKPIDRRALVQTIQDLCAPV